MAERPFNFCIVDKFKREIKLKRLSDGFILRTESDNTFTRAQNRHRRNTGTSLLFALTSCTRPPSSPPSSPVSLRPLTDSWLRCDRFPPRSAGQHCERENSARRNPNP
ncbi:uncharacterized [Tachysurus ichikawai]